MRGLKRLFFCERLKSGVIRVSFAEAGPKDSFSSLIESGVSLLLTEVANLLTEQGVESYLVGGVVRDVLLGRDTADIDLAVDSDALEVAPRIATALGGRYVPLDRLNRVARVVLDDRGVSPAQIQWELDFSTFRGGPGTA
jgi:tRNA nucleotidyltransferase/poly(A) polymerase